MPIEGLATRSFRIDEVEKRPIEMSHEKYGQFANPYTIDDFDRDLDICLEYGRYLADVLPPFLDDVIIGGGIFSRILNNEFHNGGDIDVWPFAPVGEYDPASYGARTIKFLTDLYEYFFNDTYLSAVVLKERLNEQLVALMSVKGEPQGTSRIMGMAFEVDDVYPINEINLVLHPSVIRGSEVQTLMNFDYAHCQIGYNPKTDMIHANPLAMCCARHKILKKNENVRSGSFRRQNFLERGFIL